MYIVYHINGSPQIHLPKQNHMSENSYYHKTKCYEKIRTQIPSCTIATLLVDKHNTTGKSDDTFGIEMAVIYHFYIAVQTNIQNHPSNQNNLLNTLINNEGTT